MPLLDPRIDAYIAASPDFARPILAHVRAVVHAACPEVEETMKWSRPHFLYQGILLGMSAFKAHCAVGFWKGALIVEGDEGEDGMGQFGRITSVKDLPSKKVLAGYVKLAMQLNEEGVVTPARQARAARPAAPPVATPADLAAALAANKAAKVTFESGSPSFRREYVDWIDGAKAEATRQRRLLQTVEWLAEGKARNWKYAKC